MKEKMEKKVLKVTERILRTNVILPGEVWSPTCTVFIHQPKRPIKNHEN